MGSNTTGALGEEARWCPKAAAEGRENHGRDRSGATSDRLHDFRVSRGALGCVWELSGSASGCFRNSEVNSRSLWTERFEGTLETKTGTFAILLSELEKVWSAVDALRGSSPSQTFSPPAPDRSLDLEEGKRSGVV